MKKDSRTRLFEVMGRLDKTFKPNLNEGFEEMGTSDDMGVSSEVPAEMGAGEMGIDEPQEEKSPEEKLSELTAKVDELYALLHGEGEEEIPEEEPDGMEAGEVEPDGMESDEEDSENLQEWNFDKKKGEKKEKKDEEEGEEEEKKEVDEAEETKPKIPVAAVAKVGK